MYATEEERIKALRESRHKYQKNKERYCDICCNGKNYTARGKTNHEKTKKHLLNSLILEKAKTADLNILKNKY